jgi:signal transduction histidine kinase
MILDPLIIYIEDNLDNQRLAQRVLTARGYRLLLAEDGPAGLALAREHAPALILVDLGIEGLDGYETTTRLKAMPHLTETPVIALTADATPGSRERALAAGCDGYLSKPIDTRRLAQQLAEFIAGKREALPAGLEAPMLRAYSQKLVERLEQRVRELTEANAELQELDRLRSQFLGSLSHELRTPLTAILGYLELCARGTLGPLTDAQNEAMSVMLRSAETLSRQINNLLYLQEVRTTELRLAPLALDVLLRRLLNDLRYPAERAGLSLASRMHTAALEPLMADSGALELALRNVIENAIKFTPPEGKVQVELQNDAARVVVRVGDTGVGIPPEALEKIFLPFYQVDSSLARAYAGSGLGLTIARHIVEAHDGQIGVQSVPGKGSIFTVTLPRK